MPHLSKRNATTLFKKNNIQSVWGQLEGSPKTTSQEASTSHAKSCRNVLSILPFGIHGINPFGNHPHPLGSKVPILHSSKMSNLEPVCMFCLVFVSTGKGGPNIFTQDLVESLRVGLKSIVVLWKTRETRRNGTNWTSEKKNMWSVSGIPTTWHKS